ELHEVHDELGFTGEPLSQERVLRGDTDRAGVEMTDPHHDAAADDQGRSGETEFLCPEQRTDDDVTAGLELTVDLYDHSIAHAVEHERLLSLGEAQLPGSAGVLERVQRARARSSVVARHQDDVTERLRDSRGDRADARLADELGVDAGLGIRALEVEDQLL